MDQIVCAVFRAFLGVLNLLPLPGRMRLLTWLCKLVLWVHPSYRSIIRRNLELAFPDETPGWRDELATRSFTEFARMVVDAARLPNLSGPWYEQHVAFPYQERLRELRAQTPQRPVLVATGHLGSFELMAQAVAHFGFPLTFLVRTFKLRAVDAWWNSIREREGNRVIPRDGGFTPLLNALRRGEMVALLLDQNVTRHDAIFVPFFGIPAATSRALALAALRTNAIVLVASITHIDQAGDRYRINVQELDFDPLYSRRDTTKSQKVFEITSRVTKEIEEMVRRNPAGWFWMHRRWRTRPEGEAENIYGAIPGT